MRTLLALILCILPCFCATGPSDDPRAISYFLRGLAIRDSSGCATAIAHFELAVRFAPKYWTAWRQLIQCSGLLGSQAGKFAALERAVAANPQNSEALGELGLARQLAGDTAGALRTVEDLTRIDRPAAETLQMKIWLIKVN